MKPRRVKTKINQLIGVMGGAKDVADELNISLSYVYHLRKGWKPGTHLYKTIVEAHDKICHQNNTTAR